MTTGSSARAWRRWRFWIGFAHWTSWRSSLFRALLFSCSSTVTFRVLDGRGDSARIGAGPVDVNPVPVGHFPANRLGSVHGDHIMVPPRDRRLVQGGNVVGGGSGPPV